MNTNILIISIGIYILGYIMAYRSLKKVMIKKYPVEGYGYWTKFDRFSCLTCSIFSWVTILGIELFSSSESKW